MARKGKRRPLPEKEATEAKLREHYEINRLFFPEEEWEEFLFQFPLIGSPDDQALGDLGRELFADEIAAWWKTRYKRLPNGDIVGVDD